MPGLITTPPLGAFFYHKLEPVGRSSQPGDSSPGSLEFAATIKTIPDQNKGINAWVDNNAPSGGFFIAFTLSVSF
ncbi:MAG: hypothetical protein DRI65_09780 [Chloroflexota bacterium]|nr:MAG: hypothetical protein DRI65_09780 [Chloroflexota bacterium]